MKEFVRRQRNPLLDRINFYNRHQQRGELFDSFFTSLKELYTCCNFTDLRLCETSNACETCRNAIEKHFGDVLRDRIVVGIYSDDTRHKLLAAAGLTLETVVKICRAEEAAVHTGNSIPLTHAVNAARKTAYQKSKHASSSTNH